MADKTTLSDLILTIAALTVRHEFCVQVEEAGGLKFISDSMVNQSTINILAISIDFNNYFDKSNCRGSTPVLFASRRNH